MRIEAALAARQLHAKAGDLREVMTYTAEVRVVEQAVRICRGSTQLFAIRGWEVLRFDSRLPTKEEGNEPAGRG